MAASFQILPPYAVGATQWAKRQVYLLSPFLLYEDKPVGEGSIENFPWESVSQPQEILVKKRKQQSTHRKNDPGATVLL